MIVLLNQLQHEIKEIKHSQNIYINYKTLKKFTEKLRNNELKVVKNKF